MKKQYVLTENDISRILSDLDITSIELKLLQESKNLSNDDKTAIIRLKYRIDYLKTYLSDT